MIQERNSRDSVETLKFLEEREISSIAEQFGTPVFVYDQKTIAERLKYFQTIPNAYGLTIRYSVKSNPNNTILRLFDSLGAHFDVSSVWEAKRVVAAGISAQKILLTAQEISDGWEQLCLEGLNFDAGSLTQMEEFGKRFPGGALSVRFNPGFGSGLVKKLTSGGAHSSFGIWFGHLEKVLKLASDYNLTITRIHTHIGSGHESEILETTVARILELCKAIPTVATVNLGGGYKIAALKQDPFYDHHSMGERIAEKLRRFAADTGRELKLELEPGTYLMSLAGSLVTTVIDVTDTGEEGFKFLKVDAGLTELMRPSYYGALHPLVVVRQNLKIQHDTADYLVCGHCCIAGDSFTPVPGNSEDFTPQKLVTCTIGDFLVVERTGGYAASMCVKNFNSYPEAPELLRRSEGSYSLIRRRQTIDQVMQNEIAGPILI